MQRLLFVCNLNSIRSPIAEAIVNGRFSQHAVAASCGIWEGGYLDGAMVDVLREIGIDMSGHVPRVIGDVDPSELTRFSHVVTLSEESAQRIEAVTASISHLQVLQWVLPDPTGEAYSRETRLLGYRSVRDDLVKRLQAWFEEMS